MRYKNCCPVCRAICCVFNENDTCCKYIPSKEPGYSCPDFICSKEDDRPEDLIRSIFGLAEKTQDEDDIPIVFVELSGRTPYKAAGR